MKLFIIDDDPVSRTALLDILGPHQGWDIREAENGLVALDILHSGFRPDLCLLDLQMPDMGGVELLKRMRCLPEYRNLKVVVTSAERERRTIETLARLQISGYLLKPFDAAKTRAVFDQFLTTATVSLAPGKSVRRTVLAVDDDPVIRTAISEHVLGTSDWDIHLASDGEEAFEHLYSGLRPDLIITDLNMPKSDGLSFISRIRRDRNFSDMRVAVIAGEKDTEKEQQLSRLNVFSYMQKPVNSNQMDALLDRVRRKLEAAAGC